MGPPDAELVTRVVERDDRHAFATLVRRHQSAVRGLLRRLTCGNQARADDLSQETFLRAYQSIGSYRGAGKLSSWLLRIAYRTFVSHARAASERATEELSEKHHRSDPGAGLAHVLERHDLLRAMRVLTPEERAAVALTYGEDLSHDEAARILGWPLGTLKTRVLSAKERLRAVLADPAEALARTDPPSPAGGPLP